MEPSGILSSPARYLDDGEQPALAPEAAVDRSKLPDVGTIPNVDFPAVETTSLSNGIKLHFARRGTVPTLRMTMTFDAGAAADPKDAQGTQALMLAMLKEGTKTRSSIEIAEEQERLGAAISVGATLDRTAVSLYALTPNLGPSLDLLADIVLHPSFDAKELERVRAGQLAQIAQEQTVPKAMARAAFFPAIYGKGHPYANFGSGTGDPDVVSKLNSQDLASFHRKWIRADTAEIFAVGDTTIEELKKELEARFAAWPMTRDMPGKKNFAVTIPAPSPRIILVDRPQSPQSYIYAGEVLNGKGGDDMVDLISANDILGGNFLSRINMDLRETKGWSYGVGSVVDRNEENVAYIVVAPVQADKTGESIKALQEQMAAFLTDKGVTPEELERMRNGSIRELPGSFETSAAVLAEMQRDALFGRPFDYVEGLADKYRAQTGEALDSAARQMIDPAKFTWVVVGDKSAVLPQLEGLGLPVETVENKDAAASDKGE